MSEVEQQEKPKRKLQRLTSCTDESNNVEYFELANPIWYILSLFLFGYSSALSYIPHMIPFEQFGQVGEFSRFLTEEYQFLTVLAFWGLAVIHLLEAIYVVSVAHQFYINPTCLNMWFLQTCFVGYPSTKMMLHYAKVQHEKRK